jgi:hypothetical protein
MQLIVDVPCKPFHMLAGTIHTNGSQPLPSRLLSMEGQRHDNAGPSTKEQSTATIAEPGYLQLPQLQVDARPLMIPA